MSLKDIFYKTKVKDAAEAAEDAVEKAVSPEVEVTPAPEEVKADSVVEDTVDIIEDAQPEEIELPVVTLGEGEFTVNPDGEDKLFVEKAPEVPAEAPVVVEKAVEDIPVETSTAVEEVAEAIAEPEEEIIDNEVDYDDDDIYPEDPCGARNEYAERLRTKLYEAADALVDLLKVL